MYDRDSGGEPPPDDSVPGACCQQLEQSLRLSLEGRIVELEVRMAEREQQNAQYMTELKECVIVRDEKILALNCEMNKRDELIAELKLKLVKSEESVKKLTESVQELITRLNSSAQAATGEVNDIVTVSETTSKMSNEMRKKTVRKTAFKPLSMEEIFAPEPFCKFFVISLPQSRKQSLCPFEIEKSLIMALGGQPVSLSNSGTDSLLVQVANKSQSTKIEQLTSLCELQCVVKKHDFFNTTRGLIYIYNTEFEEIESFKKGLIERYHLQSVEEATWIKTRNPSTKVFLLSSYQDKLPEYVRIISEATTSRVYPYQDSPLRCKKCLKYGHTAKRCNSDARCERCSGHHTVDRCEEEDLKCFNCEGAHRAGSRDCPVLKKEESVLNMQKKMKVGRAEARTLVESGASEMKGNSSEQFCEYYKINADSTLLRKKCPFRIEKYLTSKLDVRQENISSDKRNYIIKCESKSQSNKAANLKTVLDIPCSVSLHEFFNQSKGLIYVKSFMMANEERFLAKLKSRFNLCDVVAAEWIKPRDEHTKPLLLTFNSSTPPYTIEIPGERLKVYEYLPRPLFCKRCLEYAHTQKRCGNAQRCQRCSLAHKTENCRSGNLKCFHCEGDHPAGSSKCTVQTREQQITLIRYKEKVSWPEARQRYSSLFPDGETNFAKKTTVKASDTSMKRSETSPHVPENGGMEQAQPSKEGATVTRKAESESLEKNTMEREKRRRNNSEEGNEESARKKILTLLSSNDVLLTDSDLESSETNQRVREEARRIFDEFSSPTDN